jgi:hypothetical protein
VTQPLLRQSLRKRHQVNESLAELGNAMSVFIPAHQQANKFAFSLLAIRRVTFAMRSGETLARSDSDGIARFW